MQIENYYALLLILLLPLMFYLRRRFKKTAGVKVASISNYKVLKPTLKQRTKIIPDIFRVIALLLLILAIARPRIGSEKVINHSEGIAIEMVLDRSSSMQASMEYSGRKADRLEVAKDVFADFILGKDGLDGRMNDLVGIISYARYSDTICPLTLDHDTLPEFLQQIHLPLTKNEDGTAIGDALELAAARLYTAEKELQKRKILKSDKDSIKSKIIILLTDGQDNSSRTSIPQAVKLCKEWGIKVYTIGIGGNTQNNVMNAFFGNAAMAGNSVDTRSLEYISSNTGGKFFMAGSDDAMKKIYQEIDRLEKSEVESIKYTDYAEKFMYLAIPALALLILELILRATIYRVIP